MPRSRLTLVGAEALARKIRAYWMSQGYLVHAWTDRDKDKNGEMIYMVKTDMINGLPRKWRPNGR